MNPFLLLVATTAGPSRGSLPPSAPIDIHVHQGRLKHQYAKQPRPSSHRICRGRP